MDDTQHANDFLELTIDQIRDLADAIREDFSSDLSRTAFINHLLALLEDVPGFETGDVPASLIETAWFAYHGVEE